MPSIDPKAAGCEVSFSDTGRVLTSCAIFMSFFNFGSCLAALGSALPQIAHDKGVSETSLGYVFIARGIGQYLIYMMIVIYVLCMYVVLYTITFSSIKSVFISAILPAANCFVIVAFP